VVHPVTPVRAVPGQGNSATAVARPGTVQPGGKGRAPAPARAGSPAPAARQHLANHRPRFAAAGSRAGAAKATGEKQAYEDKVAAAEARARKEADEKAVAELAAQEAAVGKAAAELEATASRALAEAKEFEAAAADLARAEAESKVATAEAKAESQVAAAEAKARKEAEESATLTKKLSEEKAALEKRLAQLEAAAAALPPVPVNNTSLPGMASSSGQGGTLRDLMKNSEHYLFPMEAKVIADYLAMADGELDLEQGQQLQILRLEGSYWCGKLGGTEGTFPITCVEVKYRYQERPEVQTNSTVQQVTHSSSRTTTSVTNEPLTPKRSVGEKAPRTTAIGITRRSSPTVHSVRTEVTQSEYYRQPHSAPALAAQHNHELDRHCDYELAREPVLRLVPNGTDLLQWCLVVEAELEKVKVDMRNIPPPPTRMQELEPRVHDCERSLGELKSRVESQERMMTEKFASIEARLLRQEQQSQTTELSIQFTNQQTSNDIDFLKQQLTQKVALPQPSPPSRDLASNALTNSRMAMLEAQVATQTDEQQGLRSYLSILNIDTMSATLAQHSALLDTITNESGDDANNLVTTMQRLAEVLERLDHEESHTQNFFSVVSRLEHNDQALLERVKKQETIIQEQQVVIEKLTHRLIKR